MAARVLEFECPPPAASRICCERDAARSPSRRAPPPLRKCPCAHLRAGLGVAPGPCTAVSLPQALCCLNRRPWTSHAQAARASQGRSRVPSLGLLALPEYSPASNPDPQSPVLEPPPA